jgi:hypothetical protein
MAAASLAAANPSGSRRRLGLVDQRRVVHTFPFSTQTTNSARGSGQCLFPISVPLGLAMATNQSGGHADAPRHRYPIQ